MQASPCPEPPPPERLTARRVRFHPEVDVLRQIQPVSLLSVLRRIETRMGDLRPNLPGYYARHPGALLRRIGATLRYGFSNRYLTVAAERPESP